MTQGSRPSRGNQRPQGSGNGRGAAGNGRGATGNDRGAAGNGRGGSGAGRPSSNPRQGSERGGESSSGSWSNSRGGEATSGSWSKTHGGPKQGKKPGTTGAKKYNGPKAFGKERFGQNLGPVKPANPNPNRPTQRERAAAAHSDLEGVRLQKVMANAGVASRRVCEEMILAARVEVNGSLVTELGIRIDPEKDSVHVDGMRLQLNEDMKYYVFNKPRYVVSTMEDPEGRKCISDFIRKQSQTRLFLVGRLDYATEGLLILTNDGEMANRLSHPSYEVPKTYLVQVRGPLPTGIGAQMKKGIKLEDGWASVDSFRLIDSTPGHVLVEVVLHSGRNRIVRRLFDEVGHPVTRLVRVQVGPIRLGDQKQGTIRPLGNQEVGHLLSLVGM